MVVLHKKSQPNSITCTGVLSQRTHTSHSDKRLPLDTTTKVPHLDVHFIRFYINFCAADAWVTI